MERIVDRSELMPAESTPRASPASTLVKTRDFEFVQYAAPENEAAPDEEGSELEFQLFAPAVSACGETATATRIRLKSPQVESAAPGFVVPERKWNHYFTEIPSATRREEFNSAAISGYDILTGFRSIRPGSAYAWKVLHIPETRRQRVALSSCDASYADVRTIGARSKRTRPGKKARIASRRKLAVVKARQEEERRADELKKASEEEKRIRRNREKKAKKKLREKAKKAAVPITVFSISGLFDSTGRTGNESEAS